MRIHVRSPVSFGKRPGFGFPVDTDMNPVGSEFAKVASQFIALQRYGHADEIASFVAYLANPETSFITGASLLADGGYAA